MVSRDLRLRLAAEDIRHLLSRGYPRTSAVRFVCDHHRLALPDRHILMRTVIEPGVAASRIKKKIACAEIRGRELMVDGYNVLIATESIISGEPVFLCDDGFIRDVRGVFRNYKNPDPCVCMRILEMISRHAPEFVTFLFDAQISKSGRLARHIREMLPEYSIAGDARTSKHVDFDLKHCGCNCGSGSSGGSGCDPIVATGDGSIIDEVASVVDIPGCILDEIGKDERDDCEMQEVRGKM